MARIGGDKDNIRTKKTVIIIVIARDNIVAEVIQEKVSEDLGFTSFHNDTWDEINFQHSLLLEW